MLGPEYLLTFIPPTPAHLALVTLLTFLFLKHAKSLPTSGPWHQLFPLPGRLCPQVFTQLSTSATLGSGHTLAYSREGPSLTTQPRAHPCLHPQPISTRSLAPTSCASPSPHLHLTPCFQDPTRIQTLHLVVISLYSQGLEHPN